MKRQHTILIISILVAGTLSFSLGWFSALSAQRQNAAILLGSTTAQFFLSGTSTQTENLRIRDLDEVWKILNDTYYDASKLNLTKMEFSAVKGFVAGIEDPYTVFMTPEESQEFAEGLEGQLEGIGAELDVRDGKLIIVTPLKNSPAQLAGLKPGDIIFKIDNALAEDMTIYEAVRRIRGKKGTQVTLTIIREGSPRPFEVTITRNTITIDSVEVEKLPGDIFHISIHQFNDHMKTEFQNAIQRILLEKASAVILDFRGNGGGYLDTSVDIVSEFVAGIKPVVIIKKRNEEDSSVKTTGNVRLPDIPLVVLADRGSASASEIVAGALQDYKRAIVIGETTFGKGSVQEIDSLRDGASMRITIAKWFTPLNRSIDEVGITPDLEVKFTDEDRKLEHDPQLDEAVRYLRNLRNR